MQQQKEELLEKKAKQAEQETVIERLKEQIQQLKWSQKQQSLAEKVFENEAKNNKRARNKVQTTSSYGNTTSIDRLASNHE